VKQVAIDVGPAIRKLQSRLSVYGLRRLGHKFAGFAENEFFPENLIHLDDDRGWELT
jgi:hypothetical protein